MTPLEIFFDSWSLPDHAARKTRLEDAITPDSKYVDARTDDWWPGPHAIADHIGGFVAAHPKGRMVVLSVDHTENWGRANVAMRFPDRRDHVDQYFFTPTTGKIERMIGFLGTGALE